MHRTVAVLAVAFVLSASSAVAQNKAYDRRATLQLILHDFLREDSRVLGSRQGFLNIEDDLTIGGVRYHLTLQRPPAEEHFLVIDSRDGSRCPGLQSIVVGVNTGNIIQGVCQANLAVVLSREREYYERELDRILRRFQPIFEPYRPKRPGSS